LFVERLKEMLAENEWRNVDELRTVLEEVITEYNDARHQGLDGLSPKEYERRIMNGERGRGQGSFFLLLYSSGTLLSSKL
jgi:hypothetical protein